MYASIIKVLLFVFPMPTDCCIREGVSDVCVPLCSPSTFVYDGFDPANCATDLLMLLKCGSGEDF